ncbi:S8 family serine peptidase [Porticoccaceae bacterium]|nr:S8 family serine peptidase [Porticoccaceae bacterium]
MFRLLLIALFLTLTACGGGTPNGNDTDKDGVANTIDAFPNDPSESVDTDGDGIGNNADTDDDNDGVPDVDDAFPLDPLESVDTDSDGVGNNEDTDDDGDGVLDTDDAFPLDGAETFDTDGDGIGNNADTDDDNDGVPDADDAFPLDPLETLDTDGDGVGNNEDTDDDGDGAADDQDVFPLDPTITGTVLAPGEINETQTFAVDQSPYALSGDMSIALNATLTVEPGVEILGNEHTLIVAGSLLAHGDSESPIIIDRLTIKGADNTFEKPFNVKISYAQITQGSPFSLGGDTLGAEGEVQGSGDFTLSHSVLYQTEIIEFNDPDGTMLIDKTVFASSAGIRVTTLGSDEVTISNNVFIDQTTTYAVFNKRADGSSSVLVKNNSFLSTDKVALRVSNEMMPGNIIGVENYFNTIDEAVIDTMIFDEADSENAQSIIHYKPFLLAPAQSVASTLGITFITDADNDGAPDIADAFIDDPTEFLDTDDDGIGNNADTDDDNDGVIDNDDPFPLDASESMDTDNDGIGNNADTDDDNDGVSDEEDQFPLDDSEAIDSDGDGIGNNADTDDDNDGVPDEEDQFPLDNSESIDTDGDGTGNNADTDDDNDGTLDEDDAFPLDSSEQLDTDGDGIGNNEDPDSDNDGVLDEDDAFPTDPLETVDTDGDGIGNNADTDDDNDGVEDEIDNDPLDSNITPPTAVIDTDFTSGVAPFLASFYGGNSSIGNPSDPDDTLVSMTWSSGDGATLEGDVFEHVYLTPGEYTVSLTLVNSDGLTSVATHPIIVDAAEDGLTVEGSIVIPQRHFVDSDVNNAESTPVDNSTEAGGTGQFMPNPSAVSGYVNVSNQGANGLSFTAGDLADDYIFQAAGGEVVNLTIGDSTAGDLDLYLYDLIGGDLVEISMGINTYESVVIPGQSTYAVIVAPFSGASTYTLEIGGLQSFAAHGWSTASDLTPGVIVATKSKSKSTSMSKTNSSALSAFGIRALDTAPSSYQGPLSYSVEDQSSAYLMSITQLARKSMAVTGNVGRSASTLVERKVNTLLAAKRMRTLPQFDLVEPSFIYSGFTQPNDTFYFKQWNHDKIDMPLSWDLTTGLQNVKVAILDTGMHHAHPDISNQLSSDSYDFISDSLLSGDGDGHDSNATDPGTGSDNIWCPESSNQISEFHGTHVGGIVGASGNNAEGVAGVSWNVELMDVRVLGCNGRGNLLDIVDGIYYASGLPNRWDIQPEAPADIINLSLGSSTYSQALADAVMAAHDAGVIVIAAAGNNALTGNAPNYPASNDGVVSVGATNPDDVRADYSTYNPMVDITAPGGHGFNAEGSPDKRIYSTAGIISGGSISPTYAYMSGTSMAAPHVAGVASLMKELHPDLTPQEFDNAIISGRLTVDLGPIGQDDSYGYGRIDGYKASLAAMSIANGETITFNPKLAFNAGLINMGFSSTNGSFNLFNAGDGELTVSSVSSDSAAVSVFPPIGGVGVGTYTFSVDRQGLNPGVYTGVVTAMSSAGSATLNIRYEVLPGNENTDENVGTLYTLLYNVHSDAVEYAVQSEVVDGEYPFTIEDVTAGVYVLISGSDLDNDGFICGNGESCAMWPNALDPDYLLINESFNNLTTSSYFVNQTRSSALDQPKSGKLNVSSDSCSGLVLLDVCKTNIFQRAINTNARTHTTRKGG